MSESKKTALAMRETRLRNALSEASDDVEQQIVKVAGIAVVGGLVAYGLYKLLSSDNEEEEQAAIRSADKPTHEKQLSEYTRSDYKKAHAILERKGNSWYTSTALRFGKALAPVVLAFVKDAFTETEKHHQEVAQKRAQMSHHKDGDNVLPSSDIV